MFEGPESDLTLTENAQPALMAVSLAVMRVLETRGQASSSATSWPSSPAIRSANIRRWRRPGRSALADAARLLKLRGQAMQEAVPVGEGAMAALLGVEIEPAQEIAGRRPRTPARSAPSPTTTRRARWCVSGHKAAVERAIEIAPRRRAPSARMLLPVSAPFHCPLMQPAADAMAEALAAGDDCAAARCRWSPM